MDVVQVEIVSQSEHKVETTMEEVESEKVVVANNEVNNNEENVAEEEGKDEEHAAKKEEYGDDYNDDGDEGEEFDDFDDEEDEIDVDVDDDDNDDLLEEAGNVENKGDDVFEDEDNPEITMEGEREKEENEEKGGGSLEPEVKKLGKKNVRKLVVKRDLGKVTSKSEEKSKGDEQDGPVVGKDSENAKQEKGEGISKKNVRKLRKRNRRKVTNGNSEKVASKLELKLEASGRKKASTKVESMGMIFMCSSKTKKDCYHYKVLGLPASKRDIVGKIYKGMRLFLYDVDLKLLYGIYKAAGRGGYNIEPNAFKSQFPSQVRFTVLEDCIPLAEEKFKKVIKENYFTRTKFDCQLKSDQVKKLCKLFVAASKGPKSKRLDRSLEARGTIDRDRSRARIAGKKRHSSLDEKHRYHDYPRIRRREVVEPPLAPRIAHLASPISAPSYAYDRALETDAYRQNLLVEHRDSYERPILESRDAYRREPLIEHRDVYRRDPLLDRRDSYKREPQLERRDVYRRDPLLDHCDSYRREPLLERRGVYSQDPLLNRPDSYRRDVIGERRGIQPTKLEVRRGFEIAGRDPYISYRERQSYRDPVYVEHLSPERDRYHPVGLRPEYHSRQPEYRSTRARYQY